MSLLQQDKNTPLFSLNGSWFEAKCVKCYDADSVHVVFKWNQQFMRFKCRLYGIDSAELRSPYDVEKQVARNARDYLKSLILNKIVLIQCHDFDKYGRLLVSIYTNTIQNPSPKTFGGSKTKTMPPPSFSKSVNQQLIDTGYAYAYRGGKKKQFGEWYVDLNNVI